MPDAVRDMAAAVSQGKAADIVLERRFRTAGTEFTDQTIGRSAAEIMRDAASALVAQANHTRASVVSLLAPAALDLPNGSRPVAEKT
jgi:hypothetical protein